MKTAAFCTLFVLLFTACFESVDVPPTIEVKMAQNRFVPDTLRVERGTSIRWVNNDSIPHNTRGPFWTTPNLLPGRAFEERMHHAGPYAYHCTLHEGERGMIIVR